MTDYDRRLESEAGDCDAIDREMAEREAIIKRAEMLEWAYQRQAARGAPQQQSYSPPTRRSAATPVPASFSRDWQDYINSRIRKAEESTTKAILKAVAHAVIDEERQREALGERVKALEAEIAELRGKRGLRSVQPPSEPGSMIA